MLRGISWKSIIAFLDDVVILGLNFDSHLRNLSYALRRFDQYDMKLKPKKMSTSSELCGVSGTSGEQ